MKWADLVAHDEARYQREQSDRDEEEAYRRNAEMDRQADHINERVQGAGPGYEERAPEIDANDDYLSWLDDEGWGQEHGNPPDSVLRDLRLDRVAGHWPERKAEATEMHRGPGGEWAFEDWATSHGYSDRDIEQTEMLEADRENRLAFKEGKQIVSEIDRYAADPQYADVKDQIQEIGDYVRGIVGLGDREPGQLWASGEI